MKIKRENLPPGEDKPLTVLPQSPLQTKTSAKKRRMGTAHDQTYQSGGQKIRVQPRSQTLFLANLTNEQVKEANDTAPAPSNADRTDARLEVTGEEGKTETGGLPPLDI